LGGTQELLTFPLDVVVRRVALDWLPLSLECAMSLPAADALVPSSPSCETLAEVFSQLRDARGSHGRVYPFASVLLLCVVAVLHGCKNPSQIFTFGRLRPTLLRRLGFRPTTRQRGRNPWPKGVVRCPNEDTIATLLGSVDPADFNACIALWITRMLPSEVHVACDGKALKGTEEHLLEVFVNDLRLVAWQAPVGEKQNELSTLEKNIADIFARYPQIKLLTGDAMFCQKTIASAVIDARRDYFLQLKSPHKSDVKIARQALSQLAVTPSLARTEEKRGDPTAANLSRTNSGATSVPKATVTGAKDAQTAGPDCGR